MPRHLLLRDTSTRESIRDLRTYGPADRGTFHLIEVLRTTYDGAAAGPYTAEGHLATTVHEQNCREIVT